VLNEMKDINSMLEKAFGMDSEELEDSLQRMCITFRGYTIYVQIGRNNKMRVGVEDVIQYYKHEAGNIYSGCRTLAKLSGDWRPIDELAKTCLNIYKVIKRPELEKIANKNGMQLKR
jgi:hypothetical protein